MSNTWTDLLAAVGVAPALPGARCRGKHHLFDDAGKDEAPEVVAQRHQQALGLCRSCPALASCGRWVDSLPRSRRPPGVVAGVVHAPKPPGRPRKEPA
ncbi:hypothetical protein [Mycolicibacterium brisbanense]|uniref:4Fe-4S Wbl-type domain-containing protein n=1 Tax=Mycolicibacterium brisbanense TaxID=146020 RepID=A0A117I4V4_9MYCO|nr:hypothetical protein [Mycolicibacterium brisbanense]MCV7159371.1 hypothetical protein [Mycolicibacterium brisbanense]GAS87542.1 uncharacterized protein RMCB_1638 [Mycolicibacterium brisbanense]